MTPVNDVVKHRNDILSMS